MKLSALFTIALLAGLSASAAVHQFSGVTSTSRSIGASFPIPTCEPDAPTCGPAGPPSLK